MSEVFGLFGDQHRDVGRLVRGGRVRRRGFAGAGKKSRTYQPPVRCIAMTDREYDPLYPELLPIFGYSAERTVYTVSQVGSALAGYLALIINGTRHVVESRRENLNDVQTAHPGLRITVLPGLWEFDFGELTAAQAELVTIEVENITSDENTSLCALFDDTESVIFTGSWIIRQEAWCTFGLPTNSTRRPESESGDLPSVVHVDVADAIPFSTGTVKRGAIGLAFWSWDGGYICTGWECRTFSHATGYVQADDPALIPVEEPPTTDPQPELEEEELTEETIEMSGPGVLLRESEGEGFSSRGSFSLLMELMEAVSTDEAAEMVSESIEAITAAAPEALNTLGELAAAIADDAELAETIDSDLAAKYAKPVGGIPLSDLASTCFVEWLDSLGTSEPTVSRGAWLNSGVLRFSVLEEEETPP